MGWAARGNRRESAAAAVHNDNHHDDYDEDESSDRFAAQCGAARPRAKVGDFIEI